MYVVVANHIIMAAEGMSNINGGQETKGTVKDGKTINGKQLKKDYTNDDQDKVVNEKPASVTMKKKNVGDLLIAIGEIFGDELVSNQKKDDSSKVESNNQTETANSTEQETGNITVNPPEKHTLSHCCEICDESFNKKIELKEHLFVHTGHFKFKCDFENCGWSFKTKYKLERHQSKHSADKRFKCPIEACNRSFSESYKLKSHIEIHMAMHKCHDCDVACSTDRALQNHRAKAHSKQIFKCLLGECSEVFTSKSERENHVKTHRRFVCPFPGCQKPFTRKSYLDVHARSHTNERPYKCNYQGCFATFTSSSKLNRHQKAHASSRPFICSFKDCDSSFKRKDNLTQHINMHHHDNKFSCPYPDCTSTFSAKSSLKEHISRHTKQDVYRCPIDGCAKTYYSKNVLGTHVKRHQKKIEREENNHQEQECRSFMIEIVPKTNDSAQHTDISVNEILIPAKTDPTGIINYKSDVTGINPENTVISLGEAVCFQYMNSSDRLPYAGEQNETSEEQDNTNASSSNQNSNNDEDKARSSPSPTPVSSTSYDINTFHDLSTKTQPTKDSTVHEPTPLALKYMNSTENDTHATIVSLSSSNNTEATSKIENPSPIFNTGTVTIPLSMTRFLPREIQVNELFHSDYSDDHAYNRSLLPVDSRTSAACDNRSIDNVIEKALTASDFGDSLSVSNASESIMEMRSFLVENGMASFLANDDIGRMETCTSQDELSINRPFERSRDIGSSMMLDECIINHQSGSLNAGFNHYASGDSYVSLIGSSQIVNEHLLNISNNPTMIDHMYSQHSPEEDDLQMASEDHVYEESTVNIQDIR